MPGARGEKQRAGEVPRGVNKLLADIVCARWHRAQFQLFRFIFFLPLTPHCPFPAPAIRRLVFCAANSSRRVRTRSAGAPPRHSTLVLPRGGGTGVSRLVSRLAQSAWMVIKSALLRPAEALEKRCIITMRTIHACASAYVRASSGTFLVLAPWIFTTFNSCLFDSRINCRSYSRPARGWVLAHLLIVLPN